MLAMTDAQARAVEMLIGFCATGDRRLLDRVVRDGPLDWGHLLYFADINGLLGMLCSMTGGLEDSRVPWRAATRLDQWVKRQRRRWELLSTLLADLSASCPLDEPPILLKGAAL